MKLWLIAGGVALLVVIILFIVWRNSQVQIEQAKKDRSEAELAASMNAGSAPTNVWDVIKGFEGIIS